MRRLRFEGSSNRLESGPVWWGGVALDQGTGWKTQRLQLSTLLRVSFPNMFLCTSLPLPLPINPLLTERMVLSTTLKILFIFTAGCSRMIDGTQKEMMDIKTHYYQSLLICSMLTVYFVLNETKKKNRHFHLLFLKYFII